MKLWKDIPRFDTLGFSDQEREATTNLAWNLSLLATYVDGFQAAVDLADYAETQADALRVRHRAVAIKARENTQLTEEFAAIINHRPDYDAWVAIAARDTAITVYNYSHAVKSLSVYLRNCPTINSRVDHERLRSARKLLCEYFPNINSIRNAVGHASEQADKPEKIEEHSFSGSYKQGGLEIQEAQQITQNGLIGRTLTMTWKNQIVQAEASEQKLQT